MQKIPWKILESPGISVSILAGNPVLRIRLLPFFTDILYFFNFYFRCTHDEKQIERTRVELLDSLKTEAELRERLREKKEEVDQNLDKVRKATFFTRNCFTRDFDEQNIRTFFTLSYEKQTFDKNLDNSPIYYLSLIHI